MDRWAQIESLFHDALQCDPAERDDFVRQACRGDVELQREVRSLLANHEPSRSGEPWAAAAAARLIDPSLYLESGQRLGPYRIQSFLAAGGMGKVYRAVDTRLDREVAIKLSAARFSEHFEREARAIASFNHPNICQLYDVGPNYLVMELVEGPTLAERIGQGPLPMDEALGIARQIAEGLEAAHAKGRVHCDLKPANIKITPEGTVKLLDFGLAKAVEEPGGDRDRTVSPAAPAIIVGTAAYLSPEQARGQPVDKRADIWSFGVVLMEMLTSKKAFGGSSDSEVLASVIKDEPDFGNLPRHTPPAVRKLLRRCLNKDSRRRLQAIGEARIAIDDILAGAAEPDQVAYSPAITWAAAALVGLAALAGAGLAVWSSKSQPDAQVMQMEITAPRGTTFGPVDGLAQLSLSPDGRQLVFIASDIDGKRRLWLRSLVSGTAAPLPGTENVGVVFVWSPDSRWVGFTANRKFQKIEVAGGSAPQVICECVAGTATWNNEGTIIFATREQPLQFVRASGEKPAPVFGLDVTRGETWQGTPDFLPYGKHFIYDSFAKERGAVLASLDGGTRRFLAPIDGVARFAPNPSGGGWLLYVINEQLFARPFNWEKGQLTGEGVLVSNSMLGGPSFSVSRNGLIAFRHTRGSQSQLTWFNRAGTQLSTSAEPGNLRYPRISPDQKTVVFVRREAGNAEIWLLDRNQNKSTRFTDDRGLDGFPVWSPDSSRIIYLSQRQNERLLVERPANIIGLESVLFRTPGRASESFRLLMVSKLPTGLSPDGRWIIASEWFGSSSIVWLIPRNGNGGPIRFTEGADATVSPDGHWLLFATSGPAGAAGIGLPEVFVEFLPRDLDASREAQRKWQISTGGGANPTWRGDGKEIFYLALDGKMMSVPVESGENFFHPGSPRPLFQTQLAPGGLREYDVTRDGKRFVLNLPLPETRDEPITVIVNWPKLLEK